MKRTDKFLFCTTIVKFKRQVRTGHNSQQVSQNQSNQSNQSNRGQLMCNQNTNHNRLILKIQHMHKTKQNKTKQNKTNKKKQYQRMVDV